MTKRIIQISLIATLIVAVAALVWMRLNRDSYYPGYKDDLAKVRYKGPTVNGLRKDFYDTIHSQDTADIISKEILPGKEKDAIKILEVASSKFAQYLESPTSEEGIKMMDEFVFTGMCLLHYQKEGSSTKPLFEFRAKLMTPEIQRIIWLSSRISRFSITTVSFKSKEECEKL